VRQIKYRKLSAHNSNGDPGSSIDGALVMDGRRRMAVRSASTSQSSLQAWFPQGGGAKKPTNRAVVPSSVDGSGSCDDHVAVVLSSMDWDNPPKKISFYHLSHSILPLSDNKVSSRRKLSGQAR
jgi:hypothetical protein